MDVNDYNNCFHLPYLRKLETLMCSYQKQAFKWGCGLKPMRNHTTTYPYYINWDKAELQCKDGKSKIEIIKVWRNGWGNNL